MSVGYEPTKANIDSRANTLAVRLRDTLRMCAEFDAWLDTQPNQDLEALGYTGTEVAQLKSAFADAERLSRVYLGTEVVADAYDFRTFLQLIIGAR